MHGSACTEIRGDGPTAAAATTQTGILKITAIMTIVLCCLQAIINGGTLSANSHLRSSVMEVRNVFHTINNVFTLAFC